MKKLQKTPLPITTVKKDVSSPTPTPTPLDRPVKMDLEDKKEDLNIDELLEKDEKNKNIILVDEKEKEKELKKKIKRGYDIDDTIIRDITLSGDVHVRLISNTNGYFVDVRKYFNGFPTKKGIRILASKFSLAANYLKKDLESILGKPIFSDN